MSPSPQSTASGPTVPHWIGGKAIVPREGRFGDVYDPNTGNVSAKVPFAAQKDVDACVATAKAAFANWATTPPLRRARVLFRFRQLARISHSL
jgi:malonate-semialdehyde dehydrogenase (acetylating)/methylmalonate-semialdehyde dehydrogenase